MAKSLVAMLLAKNGKFYQRGLGTYWTGNVTLGRDQPAVALRTEHNRDLGDIGQLIYAENDPVAGTYGVFLVADRFEIPAYERKWVSIGWPGGQATKAKGQHVTFDGVILNECSLVAAPGAFDTTEAQVDCRDPRDGRGGHSWTTSERHKKILDRAAEWFTNRPYMRALDSVEVVDPTMVYSKPKRRTIDPILQPKLYRAMADLAASKSKPTLLDEIRPLAHAGTTSAHRAATPTLAPTAARTIQGSVRTDAKGNVIHRRENIGYITSIDGVPVPH